MFNDLAKEIAQLSPDHFEAFVFHALRAKYPGANIIKVDGSGGDAGIDLFSGSLSSGPAIWQVKAFSRLGASQKSKIIASLGVALQHNPSKWVLCVPIDLRTNEHEWFQQAVMDAYSSRVECTLLQRSDFVSMLVLDTRLRETFFPNQILSNAIALRSASLSAEGLSLTGKQELGIASMASFLEEYRKLDPRLMPVATISTTAIHSSIPSSIFQARQGDLRIDFVPENRSEYALDPIRINWEIRAEASQELQNALDYGRVAMLPVGSVLAITSSSELVQRLLNEGDLSQSQLVIGPAAIEQRNISLILSTASGQDQAQINVITQVVRRGRKEVELSSSEASTLRVRIIIPLQNNGAATVNLGLNILGMFASAVQQSLNFIDSLARSRVLTVTCAETRLPLLTGAGGFSSNFQLNADNRKLISDLDLISRTFNVPLPIPESLAEDDINNIRTLRRIATGEPFEGGILTSRLTKTREYEENQRLLFQRDNFMLKMDDQTGWRSIDLFGHIIDPGVVTLYAESLRLLDVEETLRTYDSAKEGDAVPLRAECLAPLRFLRANTETEVKTSVEHQIFVKPHNGPTPTNQSK